MSDEIHPDVSAVLGQAQRLQSVMDDQLYKMKHESFTGTDESETIEVTLNGHHWLTDVYIEDGLLRQGIEVVQQRLNEALQKATAKAGASIQSDREHINAALVDITDYLAEITKNLP